jgi:UPF0716 protein FxsA
MAYSYQTARLDTVTMWPLLLVGLLVVPIAELWVIVEAADRIGVASTLALLIVISVAGASLLRQQGTAAWRRLQQALARGDMPSRELVDGALVLVGGVLLLTPGFVTDVVGLALLLPPTRAATKGVARALLARRARAVRPRVAASRVYPTEVTNLRRREVPPRSPAPPRSGEGGSRGTS